MDEPSKEVIDGLKVKHADRALKLMEVSEHDGESFSFVYTGPSRVEYEKFVSDMEGVSKLKSDAEKTMAVREAMEKLSLQQIRWPDRQTVSEIFSKYPMLVLNTGAEISKATGDSFEVRSKKL